MLGKVIFASKIENKQLTPFGDGLAILKQDAETVRPCVYQPYKGHWLNCGNTDHYQVFSESEITKHVRKLIDDAFGTPDKLLPYGAAPYLAIEEYPESYRDEFLKRAEKSRNERKEKEEQKRIDAEKLEIERKQAVILSTTQKIQAGEPIGPDEFIDLLYHYDVKVSPRTVGSIHKSMASINNDVCRIRKGCKADFWTPFLALQEVIKGA